MRQKRQVVTTLALLMVVSAACSDEPTPGEQEGKPERITLLGHDSFIQTATAAGAFDAFTQQTGVEVALVAGGDAGTMVNQAVLTKDNPIADVMFGIDDTFLSRAVDEGVFLPYESPLSSMIPDELVTSDRVVPIDYGDVCINYDKGWFEENDVEVPADLDAFRDEAYGRLLTVEHPATSSPGLAFLIATIDAYGEDGWKEYWADLRQAGVNVVSDWDTAYFGDFTRYGGDSPLVVSYASSPPAEVILAEEPLETAPTAVLEDGCYRQVEYAGILAGTEWPVTGGQLIDYMLSVEFQETIPLNWFVFPVREDATLPDEFVEHTVIPSNPSRLPAEEIAENRERWIDEWISIMEG